MPEITLTPGSVVAIQKPVFDRLLAILRDMGYETIGPRVRDAALVYTPIEGLQDLPLGFRSEQKAGQYRLIEDKSTRYFDITPGAQSWKQFLFPPRSELFRLSRQNAHWQEQLLQEEAPKYAFIGVRGCDLAAIAVQDKVFIRPDFTDPIYANRRKNLFILSVNCHSPNETCFCASLGTGPAVETGFDLNLIELEEVFLIEVGSQAGIDVMHRLPLEAVNPARLREAARDMEAAKAAMGRELPDAQSVPELLLTNLEHPRWKEVAARCLSCTSCTQVCPTCFCWDVEEETSLDGNSTQRTRVWDSCFDLAYSAQAGGNTRPTTRSRYRQWLTHKMGSWEKQFGVLGCVGCGRCITWCPAGIDITEEIKAIRERQSA